MAEHENPYQPPSEPAETPWPPPFEAEQFVAASRWQRFWASTADFLVFMGMTAILRRVGWWPESLQSTPHSFTGILGVQPTPQSLKMSAAAAWLWLVMQGFWLHRHGQTVGKRALRIRVVDLAGNKPNLWTLYVVRHLAFIAVMELPYVGLLIALVDSLAIFGPGRRCLHDYLAGTWVVRVPAPVRAWRSSVR